MGYDVSYSPEAVVHLTFLTKSEQVIVLDEVDLQLTSEPALSTRKRKLLRPNPIAPWVLRLGELRVFYEVNGEPPANVIVKAIGKKAHNELWIGGEKVEI